MTLDERVTRLEVEVGQQNELLSKFAEAFVRLETAVIGISQRLDRIEVRLDSIEARLTNVENRLTNVESDLAILKSWLGPPSENGN